MENGHLTRSEEAMKYQARTMNGKDRNNKTNQRQENQQQEKDEFSTSDQSEKSLNQITIHNKKQV